MKDKIVFVTEDDIVQRCDGGRFLARDPCGPESAFFWAAAALLERPSELAVPAGCRQRLTWSAAVSPSSPKVNAFGVRGPEGGTAGGVRVAVRGTVTGADAASDATVRVPWALLKRRLLKGVRRLPPRTAASASASEGLRRAMLDDVAELENDPALRAGFHHGFYMLAARAVGALAARISDEMQPGPVVLYGHSLGAGVASFLYRWLSLAGAGPRAWDVRLAVLSCPAICDDACYRRWFAALDDGRRARHYHTEGDAVVRRLPGVARLDSHATREGEYVAASWVGEPLLPRSVKDRLRFAAASALLSHLTIAPATLRHARTGRPLGARACRDGDVLSFARAKASAFARRLLVSARKKKEKTPPTG